MKKTIAGTLAVFLVGSLLSCGGPSQAEIAEQASHVVASNPEAAVEVIDGTAHLTGDFEDAASRDQMIDSLKVIPGIKDVMDMTHITPKEPTPEENVEKIQYLLQNFPSIKVTLEKGVPTLNGEITADKAGRIFRAVDKLGIKYNNNLIID